MSPRRYRLEQLAVAFGFAAWGWFTACRLIFRRCPCCDCP